jgi:hypothetical protein
MNVFPNRLTIHVNTGRENLSSSEDFMTDEKKKSPSKEEIAKTANEACHLPGNKNGPDLSKGGKKGETGMSDFA